MGTVLVCEAFFCENSQLSGQILFCIDVCVGHFQTLLSALIFFTSSYESTSLILSILSFYSLSLSVYLSVSVCVSVCLPLSLSSIFYNLTIVERVLHKLQLLMYAHNKIHMISKH